MQPPRGHHRQAGDIAHHRAQPAVAQPFLHTGQHRSVVPGLDEDHPAGQQAGLFKSRREQILPRHAPKHLAGGAGGDPGRETGRRGTIHRAIAAARHLVQAAERQPAAGQLPVQRSDAEGQDVASVRSIAFEARDARPKLGDGGAVGMAGHAWMASFLIGTIFARIDSAAKFSICS